MGRGGQGDGPRNAFHWDNGPEPHAERKAKVMIHFYPLHESFPVTNLELDILNFHAIHLPCASDLEGPP